MSTWEGLLICLRCRSPLQREPTGATCPACRARYPQRNSWLDFLPQTSPRWLERAELDYAWDHEGSPLATPIMMSRWSALEARHLGRLMKFSPDVGTLVSIGGGGNVLSGTVLDGHVRNYVVADPSERQLTLARFPRGAVQIALRALGEQVPVADGTADVVDMDSVFDHFSEPSRALAEAMRILRPGGLLGIVLTNAGSWYKRVARAWGWGATRGDEHAHQASYAVSGLCGLLRQAGFRIRYTETVFFLPLPLSLERILGRAWTADGNRTFVQLADAALRAVSGPQRGGVMLVYAQKGT